MSMSSGFKTSAVLAIDETEMLPSLTFPSIAICEWQSMMPGITNWPLASMTCASFGDFTILNKDGAVLDRAVRDGEDGGVLNQDDGRGLGSWSRGRLRGKKMRGDRRCENRGDDGGESHFEALIHRGLPISSCAFASAALIDFSFGFAPVKSISTPTLAT